MRQKKTLSILASVFMILGALLTLENYRLVGDVSKHWPALVFLTGIGFALLFYQRKKDDPALAWFATFLISLAVFFYRLNYTSWTTLATHWPVFLGIVGLSFLSVSIFTKKKVYTYLALAFITLFLALYLVFTVSLRLWPMSLVVFGLSLLMIDYFNRRR